MQAVLSRPTLVLNRNWMPIQTTTAKEAISLVAKGNASIIDPETYQVHTIETWNDVSEAKEIFEGRAIRSQRLHLRAPEVIVLSEYKGMGERSVVFSRRNIFKRDRYTCQFCNGQPGSKEMTIDHVMPKSRGGRSSWENCVLACIECNSRKADRTPAEAGMKLKTVPSKPSWRILSAVPPQDIQESWEKFLDRAYWEVELKD
jgi:5-methylcytosine-specific restriction endonuclease McrA